MFDVRFDLTAYPKITLTDTDVLAGTPTRHIWYDVKLPDGITTPVGSFAVPCAVSTDVALRLDSVQKYQRGQYVVTMYVQNEGDLTPTTMQRTWEMTYVRPELDLVQDFDFYTPKLLYRDQTDLSASGFSVSASVIAWQAVIGAIATITASTSIFDMVTGGKYYSAAYVVTYSRTFSYQHLTYGWLSINDKLTATDSFNIYNVPTVTQMLDALNCMHNKMLGEPCGCGCDDDKEDYIYAQTLVSHILISIGQKQYAGLQDALTAFINISKGCLETLVVTNAEILPFTTDALGSGQSTFTYEFDIDAPITEFTLPPLQITALITVNVDGIERKVVEGIDTDVPALGTFIWIPSLLKFKWGGELEQYQWVKIKYR